MQFQGLIVFLYAFEELINHFFRIVFQINLKNCITQGNNYSTAILQNLGKSAKRKCPTLGKYYYEHRDENRIGDIHLG